MNKLLNPSVLLPLIGGVMGIAFAAFGDTVLRRSVFQSLLWYSCERRETDQL